MTGPGVAKILRRLLKEVVIIGMTAVMIFLLFLFPFRNWKRNYRFKGKASEAVSNLGAIRSTEVAFYAEWSYWVGNQPPTPVADRRGSRESVFWDNTTRFSILGFAPEGKVFCSYSLEGGDWPAAGFTAHAYCDLDGDGRLSIYTISSSSTEILRSGAPF